MVSIITNVYDEKIVEQISKSDTSFISQLKLLANTQTAKRSIQQRKNKDLY